MIDAERELKSAWQRVDDRLAALRRRHAEKGDVPLYEAALNPPATDKELQELERALGMAVPFELAYSLKQSNGRWIAHDHAIDLQPIQDHLYYFANLGPRSMEYAGDTFHTVIGPINPIFNSTKRICFGGHEGSDTSLYLDYENPPAGGQLGQIIRIGVESKAEYVAASLADYLNMIADAPVYDDDPDFDPLKLRP